MRGFTLVELLVVLSIVALLAVLAVPRVARAFSTAGVGNAGAAICEAAASARALAQAQWMPRVGDPTARFGVLLVVDDGPPYVAVTFGTSSPPQKTELLRRKQTTWRTWAEYSASSDEIVDGQVQYVKRLNLGSVVFHAPPAATPTAAEPLTGNLGWVCQPRSGAIVAGTGMWAAPRDIGTTPALVASSADRAIMAAIAIYSQGASHVRYLP